MRIVINFDLEGVTGVVLETEQTGRTKLFYEQSRMLSTGDINAVVRGAVKAGQMRSTSSTPMQVGART